MIRVQIHKSHGILTDFDELALRAAAVSPTWMKRAKARTAKFAKLGRFAETSHIWSEIKEVFIKLQFEKCAFCERKLESLKEQDVEHFRPKSKVTPWAIPAALIQEGVTATPPKIGKSDSGYHLLAYHLLNYAVACARCNSDIKSDRFPIAGTRYPLSNDPGKLNQLEQPLLVFPIGESDEDPESIISFHGISPQAISPKGTHTYKRGLTTIEFFKLDDRNFRKELFRGRAEVIVAMGLAFKQLQQPNTPVSLKATCTKIIDDHKASSSPHASCARSYSRLWESDPRKAEEVWNDAADYLNTISSGSPPFSESDGNSNELKR